MHERGVGVGGRRGSKKCVVLSHWLLRCTARKRGNQRRKKQNKRLIDPITLIIAMGTSRVVVNISSKNIVQKRIAPHHQPPSIRAPVLLTLRASRVQFTPCSYSVRLPQKSIWTKPSKGLSRTLYTLGVSTKNENKTRNQNKNKYRKVI